MIVQQNCRPRLLDTGTDLAELVQRLGQPRVLVVGDLMLDRYIWGDAERIVANVRVLYREFGAALPPATAPELFGAMGRWRKRFGRHR